MYILDQLPGQPNNVPEINKILSKSSNWLISALHTVKMDTLVDSLLA